MPIAAASIAAQAARFMELAPISSFADDTPLAQDMADQYELARLGCLEACDWSFASRAVTLPPRVPGTYDHDDDLPYAFSLPGDCARLIQVVDDWTRWRIDGRLLRADAAGPLRIRYTADITDEMSMSASFRTAVALRLAALLSPRWVGAETKIAALEDRASRALKEAMRLDARSASIERYDGGDPATTDWVGMAMHGGAPRMTSRYVGVPAVVKVVSPLPPATPGDATDTDYAAIYRGAIP